MRVDETRFDARSGDADPADMFKICRAATVERADADVAPAGGWPAEVDLILSALEAGSAQRAGAERRRRSRRVYRARAELRLFSDRTDAQPWVLYTRDAHTRGIGFITPHRLPLGYGGKVVLPAPHGQAVKVHCTLTRCRETAPGWYEGALSFSREQFEFASE